MVRGVTTVTGIQTRKLLVIFMVVGMNTVCAVYWLKNACKLRYWKWHWSLQCTPRLLSLCLCFLPLGSRRLTNISERVCKVCRRCQTVMASFPSSLATGRFSFMVKLLDNKSGASVTPLRLLQPPPPAVHHAVILTYSMEQSPSWEAKRSAASQEIPAFYGTRRFITAFTSARHLSLSWASSI